MRGLTIGAVGLGIAFMVGLFALPGDAIAQDSDRDQDSERIIEEITVTGSNIRRKRDFETPSPIQTIDIEEISASGAGQVQDLLRNLPVNSGSEISRSQSQRMGVSQFSLRGLGLSGTLTLVNGRRAGVSPIATDDGFFFTDINQYPVNMIRSIEVLTDGASATYGSEAVGGVVNILTRSDFEGIEFGAEYRNASNEAVQFNGAFGSSFDRGHFTTFVNYYEQDGNFRGDFDWLTNRSNAFSTNAGLNLFDSSTGAGRYASAADPDGDGFFERISGEVPDAFCGQPNEIGVVSTFVNGSNCHYQFINQRKLIPDTTRLQVFSQFNYDMSDDVEFFSELSFSSNEIVDGIGGAVANVRLDDGGHFVPGSHPFNYFVLNDPLDATQGVTWDPAAIAAGTPGADVIFRGRPLTNADGALADDFLRQYDNTRGLFGLNAELSENWSMTASYMYARTQFTDQQPRSYEVNAFRAAIASGAWNPFGSAWATPNDTSLKDPTQDAGNTQDDLRLFSSIRTFTAESVQQVAEVIFSGDVFELSNGNIVSVALGGQYRDLGYKDIADSLSFFQLDGRADPVFTIANTNQDVYAIFGEALIPFTDDLEVQLAVRYEDYGNDQGGDSTDPKFGVRYQATDGLLLRGSVGTSFQAPSIRNVAGAVGAGAIEDPIVIGSAPGAVCGEQAILDGLSPAGSFNAAQITTGGNLDPQDALNYNLGLVFQADRFTGSIDYWVYDFDDLISTGQNHDDIVLNECVDTNGDGITDTYVPDPRVVRNSNGQLNSVTTNFVNLGKVEAEGFDLGASYVFDDVAGGELSLDARATIITTFDINDGLGNVFDGAGNRNSFSGLGSMPDLRANLAVTWRNDRHRAIVNFRHIGSYDDRTPTNTFAGIDSQTLIDLQYGLDVSGLFGSDGVTALTVGINNVADEDPPAIDLSSAEGRISYDNQVADPRGRVFYVRINHGF